MQINIEDIKVRKRIRHTTGNLEPLKESLKRYGLMNPITINTKNELIAGERRLEAAKQLGWTTINAVYIDTVDKINLLELELEENNQRLPFTEEELMEGYARLEKLKNPGAFKKFFSAIKNFFLKTLVIQPSQFSERKLLKAQRRSSFLLIGLLLVIVGAVCAKKSLITLPLHIIIDLFGATFIIIGAFFFVRVIMTNKSAKD